ncbi:MAG: MBL fold metallo-hydrolase [Chloroflexi bacterium]|nr:MBL fold metallo-hydrolase [Chloroflexota bacterium]
MSTFTLEPVDAITLTILMDNVTDMLLPDDGPVHRAGGAGGSPPIRSSSIIEGGKTIDTLVAEHGFSTLVTLKKGGRTRTILYDAGVSPDGIVENMRRLDLSPKDIDTIVMSHGHFDHTGGLDGLIRAIGGAANLPVTLHPDFWSRRRIAVPGRDPFEIPSTSKSALQGAGFDITEERRPSFLLERSLLITGEVDRTTEFEKGFPVHQAFRDGDWQPDPLILDDQALIAHVNGKGLVILTGCGHAGIVNIVRYAQKLTGIDNVYAIVGGFHLSGDVFEPIIPATVAALAQIRPELIMPAHCTGWRAQHALAAALPDAWVQTAVGTRLELASATETA